VAAINNQSWVSQVVIGCRIGQRLAGAKGYLPYSSTWKAPPFCDPFRAHVHHT
jgi:hypothetical protein